MSMKAKTKKRRKLQRQLAAVFSQLTEDEDEDIQDQVSKEIPFTADEDVDVTEARQLHLAYQYATKLLYEKQCRTLTKC